MLIFAVGHTVRYLPTDRKKSDTSYPWFNYSPFTFKSVINTPDEIFEQYNNTSVSTYMGLFPEIERAWIAVDSRLYFWNYRGDKNDFQAFEELQEAIVAVKLVKPKKGTFIAEVNYLLVIATTDDIYLVAISHKKGKPMELYDSGMSVSTVGMQVDQLHVDNTTGRIFFSGKKDSVNLWEVCYESHDSWFRSKCSKVCRTRSGLISNLVPTLPKLPASLPLPQMPWNNDSSFNSHSGAEAIMQISIDETRSLIYVLTTHSTIYVYTMLSDREDIRELAKIPLSKIRAEIRGARPAPTDNAFSFSGEDLSLLTANFLAQPFKIVALEPIKSYQSRSVYFAAITDNGTRVYYRATTPETRTGFSTSLNLQCFHVRPGPQLVNDMVPKAPSKPGSRILEPHYFFSVMPNETTTGGDRILCCALDTAYLLSTAHGDYEVYDTLDIEGHVRAIEMITPKFSAAPTPVGYGNETAAQYTVTPPQVAIMTNTGIFIYERKFPYMVFEQLLPDMQRFYDLYGTTEVCSEALAFVCKPSLAADSLKSQVAANYIGIGGKPAYSAQQKYQNKLLFQPSGCCQGLATYLSRIIRDTWSKPVFSVQKNAATKNTTLRLNASRENLEVLQGRLLDLLRFFEMYRAHIDGLENGPSQKVGETLDEESLYLMEHRSMQALLKLVKSMREGSGFLLLLLEETLPFSQGIEAALSHLPTEPRKKLETLTFRDFFASNDGRIIAKELVTSLVNLNIARGGSVSSIAGVLQDRCESYCTAEDVILYKASEFLRKAKLGVHDLHVKTQNLYASLNMFKLAAPALTEEVLRETIEEYVSLDFCQGAVDVALRAAMDIDRANLSLAYYLAGCPANDPRSELFLAKKNIYNMIFKVLESADAKVASAATASAATQNLVSSMRDETYKACFLSEDELFHYCFYDWFFEKGLESRLMEVQTPYILSYLVFKAEREFSFAELLWIYCKKCGDSFKAAEELFKLAVGNFELSLDERMRYLSRARTYCGADGDAETKHAMDRLETMIDEYLLVASVQHELLWAIQEDKRLDSDVQKESIAKLNGKILTISELFNDFAKPLGYHDVCLAVFRASDHRDSMEIISTWTALLTKVDATSEDKGEAYKAISSTVQKLGQQFRLQEFVFPLEFLVPYLEKYKFERAPEPPNGWTTETFLNAGVSCEALYGLLQDMLERREYPFDSDKAYKMLVGDIIYLLNRWISDARARHVVHHIRKEDLDKLAKVDSEGVANIMRRLAV